MEVTCPLCRSYAGSHQSVEAHISASTDADHKGHEGRDHREELLPGELAGPEDSGDSAPESGEQDDDEQVAVPASSVEQASYDEGDDDEGGVTTLVIGGAAAYAVFQALSRQSSEEVM